MENHFASRLFRQPSFLWGARRVGGAPAGRDTCGCKEGRGRGRCPRGQRCHRGDGDAAPPASGWRGYLSSCFTTHIPLPNSLPARFSESRPIAALPLSPNLMFFGRFSAGTWGPADPTAVPFSLSRPVIVGLAAIWGRSPPPHPKETLRRRPQQNEST